MITFRQHLEISRYLSDNDSIYGYLEKLNPAQRISLIREIPNVYPLKEPISGHFDALDKFNCYISVDELVLGQFIMIEQIITGKTNYSSSSQNDFEIAKLLMRPKEHIVFDNEDQELEAKNGKDILDTDVLEVYSVLQRFLNNREIVLFKQFKGVFYEVPDEEDFVEDEEHMEKTGEALFQQQWYWYSMVRMLAREDITKYDEIYMLKMSTVMPEMSYLAQKSKIESARQRHSEAMRKL